jgi:toxin ParE1/3/4
VRWRVSIRDAAQSDLGEIRVWYNAQGEGLGDEFLASIAEAFERLEKNPEKFPIYYRGFRRALTTRFPYRIYFRIHADLVIVFRVLHVRREHERILK